MAEVQLDAGVDGSACTKRIHDEEDDADGQVSWCKNDSMD
jgi:hypothetical protein